MKTDTEWFEINRFCRLLAVRCKIFEADTLCVKITHNYLNIILFNILNIFKWLYKHIKAIDKFYKGRSKEHIKKSYVNFEH